MLNCSNLGFGGCAFIIVADNAVKRIAYKEKFMMQRQ